jgi:hypothetical protein
LTAGERTKGSAPNGSMHYQNKVSSYKIQDVKYSFYEELECIFNHMKMFLGDFNSKEGREDIFKPTTRNES